MKYVDFIILTFSWVDTNEFAFFSDQVTFNSTQRYQVDGAILGTLVIDSEADVSSLRHKFPSVDIDNQVSLKVLKLLHIMDRGVFTSIQRKGHQLNISFSFYRSGSMFLHLFPNDTASSASQSSSFF